MSEKMFKLQHLERNRERWNEKGRCMVERNREGERERERERKSERERKRQTESER